MSTQDPDEPLWAQACAQLPGLTLPEPLRRSFGAFVAQRRPDGVAVDALAAGDLLLAHAALAGETSALARLEALLAQTVQKHLARREPDAAVRDEVAQRVRTRVLVAEPGRSPRLGEYRGQGPLAAWLRVVALREHAEVRRSGRYAPGAEPVPDGLALEGVLPEALCDRARFVPLVEQALRQGLLALSERDRTLFRMHYVDGASLERVGVVYQVNKATVSRWLAAARQALLAQVLEQVRHQTGSTPEELQSVLRQIQSQLDLSLAGALQKAV
jgi:RNA polymerase sigma-70 factor (ECF subfamily)